MQDKNFISRSLLALVPVCVILLLMAFPRMYSPEPQTSQVPDESPMPDDTQVPPVVEEPQFEPEEPSVFLPPGEDPYDPKLTPKENCLKNMNDRYDQCLADLDKFPDMKSSDCNFFREQDELFCSCVEPVAERFKDTCLNNCTFERVNCRLIALHRGRQCRISGELKDRDCDQRKGEELDACTDAYKLCMQPPPPPPPPLVAIVGPTASYHPPS